MRGKTSRLLHDHIQERNQQFVELAMSRVENLETTEGRRIIMHMERGAEIVRSFVKGDIIRSSTMDHRQFVDYYQHYEQLIRLKGSLYIEEQLEFRRAVFEGEQLIEDEAITPQEESDRIDYEIEVETEAIPTERSSYNRREAVRYAERWWNDTNPAYKKFTDNCTNFISQCLRAGGAPMTGYPNRAKGWWYQANNWSYSWSVAHSLRWYLSGAKAGLRGQERQSAMELEPGDVICYDFNGNGRWQHTTIVVAKDANGEPLVNAQTSNSRMRYWKYEDSTAWTPNIQYKFFHIV